MKWFDANLWMGLPTVPAFQPAAGAKELLAVLRRTGIDRALVWHVAQRDMFPGEGNRMLAEEIKDHDSLCGCWTLLPPQTGEVITSDFFQQMRRSRIVALRAFPGPHNYLLNRTVFGRFLDEVSERRIPLLLSPGGGAPWPVIYDLLKEYPALTCVVCDIGIWSADRFTWPLLETYPGVHLDTSLLALEEGGVEAAVGRFGAGRFVFGSGFPERYPEAAMLQLVHAEIPAPDRERIASRNLEALIGRIAW